MAWRKPVNIPKLLFLRRFLKRLTSFGFRKGGSECRFGRAGWVMSGDLQRAPHHTADGHRRASFVFPAQGVLDLRICAATGRQREEALSPA